MLNDSDLRLLSVVKEMVDKGMPLRTAKEVVRTEISSECAFCTAWATLIKKIHLTHGTPVLSSTFSNS